MRPGCLAAQSLGMVTSGDHQFLTNHGWRKVNGSDHDWHEQPSLRLGDKLLGTGMFTSSPMGGPDYRRGYLCGMIRGDGHLGSYSYVRTGRVTGDVHRFRLALSGVISLRTAEVLRRPKSLAYLQSLKWVAQVKEKVR